MILRVLWITLMTIIGFIYAQYSDLPPPTIYASRNWLVADTTPIGTVVGSVSVSESDVRKDIVYGLEHAIGENIVQSEPTPLPFRVDNKTGEVFTNQSLAKSGGKNIFLFVTARYADSDFTAKYQIWVQITKSGERRVAGARPTFSKPPPQKPTFLGNKTHVSENRRKSSSTKLSNGAITNKTNAVSKSEIVSDSDRKTDDTDSITTTTTSDSKTSYNKDGSISTKESSQRLSNILLPLGITVVFSTFVIAFVAWLFRKRICRKRYKMKKDDMKKSSSSIMSFEESMVLQHWRGARALSNRYDSWDSDSNHNQNMIGANSKSGDKWEIPRHHIKVFGILGEGCFGQVWKCEALNVDKKEGPTVVAVKMLKENAGEQERKDLQQELQVMKMLDPHPNVVRLLGCCTDRDPVFVVMEYVPDGKLQSYLRHSRAQRYYNNMHCTSTTLTSQDLTSFCYQVAKGMQYLSSKGIIHRDLAARNILIGENRTCKVADFGFARDILTSHVYERKSEGRLPIRWMAPESLYDNIFSVKSDIWSYGVLIWEIVTLGSTPYPGIPAAEVMRRVRDGYRLDKPEHCRRELYNIMYYCWDKEPKARPTFTELVDLLEQLLLTETDYIQLDRFPDHSYYNMVSLSGEKL